MTGPEPPPQAGLRPEAVRGPESDIDLCLPITSTYLRKMRSGPGSDNSHFWPHSSQQVSRVLDNVVSSLSCLLR